MESREVSNREQGRALIARWSLFTVMALIALFTALSGGTQARAQDPGASISGAVEYSCDGYTASFDYDELAPLQDKIVLVLVDGVEVAHYDFETDGADDSAAAFHIESGALPAALIVSAELYDEGAVENDTPAPGAEPEQVVLLAVSGADTCATPTPEPPETGLVCIAKEATGSDEEFLFRSQGLVWTELEDDKEQCFVALDGVEYLVEEDETDGWTLDDIDCDVRAGTAALEDEDADDRDVRLTLSGGAEVYCLFVNEAVEPEPTSTPEPQPTPEPIIVTVEVPSIQPPSTGDAGLADASSSWRSLAGGVALFAALAMAVALAKTRRT